MAGCEITTVYTGIAGGHIKGFNTQGIVAVKDKEVREADIARVIDAAKAVAIPMDREVIHVLPQEFIIDDQDGIKEPLGMAGVRLEAKVHIVTGAVVQRAEHRQVRQPHRPQRGRHRAGAARLERGGPRRGREGARRLPGRHRRRHHRHRHLLRREHRPHRGHRARRQPPHQRHRRRAAHAGPRGRADQAALRLRAGLDGRQGRDHRGALGRRPAAARPRAGRSSARSSSRAWRRSSSSCTARSRSAASRTCSPPAWSSPAARRCSPGMPELAEEVLGLPVRRGMPRGIGGLVDVVKSPMYATGVGLVVYGARTPGPAAVPHPRGERLPEGEGADAGVAGGDFLGDEAPLQGCAENLRGQDPGR